MQPVLTIAGSDPSGGAGIQADLKTFVDHGVYGMAVLTALTAQDSTGVAAVMEVPPAFVGLQIARVLADIPPAAIKLGMLGEAAGAVAEALAAWRGPLVVDPVLRSTSGAALLSAASEAVLRAVLLPRATVITPNLPEAAALLGQESPAVFAARTGVAVLLTGGHALGPQVVDRLFTADGAWTFAHPRLHSRNTHGTGCTLASALAARLARGEDLPTAAEGAVVYVSALIARSRDHHLGSGRGGLLH